MLCSKRKLVRRLLRRSPTEKMTLRESLWCVLFEGELLRIIENYREEYQAFC